MDFRLEHDLNRYAGSHAVGDWFARHVAESQVEVVAVLVLLVVVAAALRRRSLAVSGAVAIAAAGVALVGNVIVSEIWTRPRPFVSHPAVVHLIVHHAADKSFPSDHSAALAAIAVAFALWRVFPAAVVFALWALMVGVARVYVGEHYPGDILGGWAVGLVCGAALAVAAQRLLPSALRPARLAAAPAPRRGGTS